MSEIKEKWKTIKHFPNYEVSTFGNIRHTRLNRLLTPVVSFGRNMVYLRDNHNHSAKVYVDNIVAYNFLPIPYTIIEPKIYHKNKDYLDDRLENLHFKKNVETNSVLIKVYLFKNNKCYLRTTLSFYRTMKYLNCSSTKLNHALIHTSIIKNDGKEYKVEYSFNNI